MNSMPESNAATDLAASTMIEQFCVTCTQKKPPVYRTVGVISPERTYTRTQCDECRGAGEDVVSSTGIPPIFAVGLDRFTIHDETDAKIVRYLRRLLDVPTPDKPMVGIIGANGRGKSRALAAWIFEAKRNRKRPALFRTWQRIDLEIRDSYNEGAPRRTIEVIDLYAKVPFLAIDDLAADGDSEHAIGHLFGILNERLNQNLPTAFTSNYTPTQLRDRWSRKLTDDMQARRLLDRLVGSCVLVESWGPSRRGEKHNA